MLDYIREHKIIIIITGISILAAVFGFLIFAFKKNTTIKPVPTATEQNELPYGFLKKNIPNEEKYLMLLGKLMAEEYGTYSKEDYSGLRDVYNQSTEDWKLRMQKLIDYAEALPEDDNPINIRTTIDPESIKLIIDQDTAIAILNGLRANQDNESANVMIKVNFVRQGQFWLVNSITVENM